MKKFVTGIMAVALVGMFSCRREEATNVNSDSIWKKYTVQYNAQSQDLDVTAVFRIEDNFGTKLKLDDNSSVSYGSVDLTWRPTWAYYSISQSSFINDGSFVWRQSNGANAELYAPLRTASKPSYLDTLTNNDSFDMPFSGDALEQGETITVYFRDGVSETKSYTQSTTGATFIPVEISSFNDLEIGTLTVYFVREKEGTFTDNSSGGEYKVTYTSENETIYLKD